MDIAFKKISEFSRGTLFELLKDAYSFEPRYQKDWIEDWKSADDFFYDNLHIADRCGFITVLNDTPIGFMSWDPRKLPAYIEIGHNCIATQHKGKKYGKLQLQEAVDRIRKIGCTKIIVTTDERLLAAQKNYESVGFKLIRLRENKHNPEYAGKLMDYEMLL
nr:GNAT family N-acetyltransferase [bacterium]